MINNWRKLNTKLTKSQMLMPVFSQKKARELYNSGAFILLIQIFIIQQIPHWQAEGSIVLPFRTKQRILPYSFEDRPASWDIP